MQSLHPGAKWKFRVTTFVLTFFIILALAFSGLSALISLNVIKPSGLYVFIILYIIISLVISEIYARLAYRYWKYELTNSELKIESGIISKKYRDVPFQRVQNIEIHRGILARIFGFSTLEIHTAGYSGVATRHGRSRSEGYIPAVSIQEAEKIKKFIIKKITEKKSGL